MDSPITRAEHEEFRRTVESEVARLTEEDKRQNERLKIVEKNTEQIGSLALSIDRMSQSIGSLTEQVKEQGERISAQEKIPASKWNRMADKALDTAVGVIVGALVIALVIMIRMYIV